MGVNQKLPKLLTDSASQNFTFGGTKSEGPNFWCYSFDHENRLVTTATRKNSVGNRTSSHRSASYGYQPFNRLTSTATSTQNIDSNGITVSKSEGSNFWRYTWDYENRLGTASTRKQSVRYKYDALGRRVQRNFGFGKDSTRFTYKGLDVLADDNAGILTKYQNGPGIDNKLRQTIGSSTSYFLADHLGSTNGLADSTGALTSQTGYDSFGNPTNASFPGRYQFTGREFDNFSGLQYSRARFYDPNLGRFTSEDPIGLAGGINGFAYVSNNPINLIDSTGLYEEDVHYYLTYYLAKQNGCFSDTEARIIAFGDQSTDDVEGTAPGYDRIAANSNYHALNAYARTGVGSPVLYGRATRPSPNDYYFGQYLHYYQDTFSHDGLPDPKWGHSPMAGGDHSFDKTATDVDRALAMAKGTSDQLSNYSKIKCGCKGLDWDGQTSTTINSFSRVSTNWPGLADINGNLFGNVGGFPFASPAALNEKVRILGVQR